LNEIGRNSLLVKRKKIAKFLMRTFTCLSTFLYGNTEPNRKIFIFGFVNKSLRFVIFLFASGLKFWLAGADDASIVVND
jgi:hypothetical protein